MSILPIFKLYDQTFHAVKIFNTLFDFSACIHRMGMKISLESPSRLRKIISILMKSAKNVFQFVKIYRARNQVSYMIYFCFIS